MLDGETLENRRRQSSDRSDQFSEPCGVLLPRLGRGSIQSLQHLVFRRLAAVGQQLWHGGLEDATITRHQIFVAGSDRAYTYWWPSKHSGRTSLRDFSITGQSAFLREATDGFQFPAVSR